MSLVRFAAILLACQRPNNVDSDQSCNGFSCSQAYCLQPSKHMLNTDLGQTGNQKYGKRIDYMVQTYCLCNSAQIHYSDSKALMASNLQRCKDHTV